MLGRVAGVAVVALAAAVPTQAEKVVDIETVKLDGSESSVGAIAIRYP
jgi:hypothetical protein